MKLTNQELLVIIRGRLDRLDMYEADSAHLEAIATSFEEGGPTMLRLISHGSKKIQVIKVLREHTGLGLADAKKLSENLPSARIDHPMKFGLEAFAKGLRDVGAEVELVS